MSSKVKAPQIKYNAKVKKFEVNSVDGELDTSFVFPPELKEGDYLPNLYIYDVRRSESNPFRVMGRYDKTSDTLQLATYGPAGYFYKLSVQLEDYFEEPYVWKIKKHGETNGRGFYRREILHVPRSICIQHKSMREPSSDIFKYWTFCAANMSETFCTLRLKVRYEIGTFDNPPIRAIPNLTLAILRNMEKERRSSLNDLNMGNNQHHGIPAGVYNAFAASASKSLIKVEDAETKKDFLDDLPRSNKLKPEKGSALTSDNPNHSQESTDLGKVPEVNNYPEVIEDTDQSHGTATDNNESRSKVGNDAGKTTLELTAKVDKSWVRNVLAYILPGPDVYESDENEHSGKRLRYVRTHKPSLYPKSCLGYKSSDDDGHDYCQDEDCKDCESKTTNE